MTFLSVTNWTLKIAINILTSALAINYAVILVDALFELSIDVTRYFSGFKYGCESLEAEESFNHFYMNNVKK